MDEIEVRTPNLASITVGKLQAKWSADGTRILRYFIDFWHNELNLHKELSAQEIYLLQGKVDELMASWDRKLGDYQRRSAVAAGKDTADRMTVEASARLVSLNDILSKALTTDNRVDWETLKDRSAYTASTDFPEAPPSKQKQPKPEYANPKITFWDGLFGKKQQKLCNAKSQFEAALEQWAKIEKEQEENFSAELAKWNARKESFLAEYSRNKQKFLNDQAERNAKIDALAHGVAAGDPQSIIEQTTIILEKSDYNDLFEKSFQVEYLLQEKTLLIEYNLPSPDHMPQIKSARFIPATGEVRETYISEREQKTNFEKTCYQICLRTIQEALQADELGNIDRVLFNGFSTYVDRTTGRDTTSCIMSLLVKRSDFEEIDLSRIDPKACFKSLKGVSAASLSSLAPIPPVMELNKEDRRFIEARNATDGLSEATNLAAMDWGDFEHLVRELFEKEFASRGGEVKITQASADGGVDAVAFDPDPITGGKIVIQAKRYTRTVGVSAVRDLYGTMQHESASRGILITTADYGPDAYQFASGKPMTLFTGSNLLYLLEKHGYRAKIDLREARKELNLRDYG